MTVPECLVWPGVYNLALRIHCELRQPKTIVFDKRGLTIKMSGKLALSHDGRSTGALASCRFWVNSTWLEKPPEIAVDEPWLRHDIEWHADKGFLCFEYHRKWADVLDEIASKDGLGRAAEYAKTWCLRSTRSLLWKHLQADRIGLKKWPKEWDSWPHYDEALDAYREEQRLAAIPKLT